MSIQIISNNNEFIYLMTQCGNKPLFVMFYSNDNQNVKNEQFYQFFQESAEKQLDNAQFYKFNTDGCLESLDLSLLNNLPSILGIVQGQEKGCFSVANDNINLSRFIDDIVQEIQNNQIQKTQPDYKFILDINIFKAQWELLVNQVIMKKVQQSIDELVQFVLQQCDLNNDSKLDKQEAYQLFKALALIYKKSDTIEIFEKIWFQEMDVDQDGIISKEDLTKVFCEDFKVKQ